MVVKSFYPRSLSADNEIPGSTPYDVDRVVRNDLQQRKRGHHGVSSALRETDSKAEPVHGSAKQGVVAVRSPSSAQYRRARLAGAPSFFLHCAHVARRALSPQPVSYCREARASARGAASTSRGGVATGGLLSSKTRAKGPAPA